MTVQMAQDEALAMQGAAKFTRRVRRRLGFSQAEFATRIDVSLETIRNWEQGKRSPTGAAKALLKVLDKAPEAVLGSLSAAARERDIPVSQVTRSLNRLETACGARLMHRTTHGLSLTDEGDTLLAHGQDILSMADVLGAELQVRKGQPSGWVRVGVSASVAEAVIAPSLPGLYARYPLLHIDIVVDDRLADMARDGIDMAIRTGDVHNDNLIARPLGTASRTLYASPAYLAQHGTPQTPDELAAHHLIGNSKAHSMNQWQRQDSPTPWAVKGQSLTDNSAVMLTLVRHGVGISRLFDIVARPWVQTGELVPLLRGSFDVSDIPVYAVMLPERHRLPKIRACVDYWAGCLGHL